MWYTRVPRLEKYLYKAATNRDPAAVRWTIQDIAFIQFAAVNQMTIKRRIN